MDCLLLIFCLFFKWFIMKYYVSGNPPLYSCRNLLFWLWCWISCFSIMSCDGILHCLQSSSKSFQILIIPFTLCVCDAQISLTDKKCICPCWTEIQRLCYKIYKPYTHFMIIVVLCEDIKCVHDFWQVFGFYKGTQCSSGVSYVECIMCRS